MLPGDDLQKRKLMFQANGFFHRSCSPSSGIIIGGKADKESRAIFAALAEVASKLPVSA